MPQLRLIIIPIRSKRSEVSPLGGVYLSFGLNWEECRRRETLLSFEIQYSKKCPPSAEFNISSELNWEECRRRETLLSIEIQYDKKCPPSAEYI